MADPGGFRERLASGPPLLLDGATGTELERRGAQTGLPLWSSHALLHEPELVERIHRDYVEAGAELLTANTFRTQARALAHGGIAHRAAELTTLAVELARRAAADAPRPTWVVGSQPTLEDCYRPDLVPDDAALAREHAEHARNLADAGCDAILVETMNTIREAAAAVQAARATGCPVWVSFVCGDDAQVLSGEPLADALAAVDADVVGVNCVPVSVVDAALPALAASGRPFGAYANQGAPGDIPGAPPTHATSPGELAAAASRWIAAGARIVGGCCGTTPEHVGELAAARR